uniref:Uncharacterized protein n=1 Tax=Cacopsylla melanoneura TaxID=428564 RepID=A0A8D8T5Y2_9HEMI
MYHLLNRTLQKFQPPKRRAIERSIAKITKSKTSSRLSVLPVEKDHFNLTASEFRDALAIRYHREPPSMPSSCDGCGDKAFLNMLCVAKPVVLSLEDTMKYEMSWESYVKEPGVL